MSRDWDKRVNLHTAHSKYKLARKNRHRHLKLIVHIHSRVIGTSCLYTAPNIRQKQLTANMMLSNSITRRAVASTGSRLAAGKPALLPSRGALVIRRFKEGEQADTSGQGGKAPKNPITGEPLTPVDPKKEGYQVSS